MAKIERKELLGALQIIKPSIPTNEDPDINKKVIIQGRAIIGLSEDLVMVCPLSKNITKGRIVAPYDELVALLSNSYSKNVDVEIENKKLTLLDSNVKAVLLVDVKSTLFDDLESIHSVLENLPDTLLEYTDEFNEAIKLCMYSASKESIQATLSCVHIAKNVVESSDDFRISRYTFETEFDGDVLIPAKICKYIVKFLPTGYYVADPWIIFEKEIDDSRTAFILSKQLDLEYNDVGEFLAVEGKECTLPKGISRNIEQVSVMATGEFEIEKTVRVEINSDKITILAESDKGLAESTLISKDISWKGDPLIFYTNPEFLAEILDKTNTMIVGSNRILFKYNSFEHVLCISAKTDD